MEAPCAKILGRPRMNPETKRTFTRHTGHVARLRHLGAGHDERHKSQAFLARHQRRSLPNMSPFPDRRTVCASLTIALAATRTAMGASLGDPLEQVINGALGPPLASAGLIARRGDGAVVLKAVAGQA